MKITITKKNAIKAVMTEPLKGNQWFHDGNVSKCEVCAVGAVLRNSTSLKNTSYYRALNMAEKVVKINDYTVSADGCKNFWDQDDYQDALKDKNYMGALSMYFEYLYDSLGYDKTGQYYKEISLKHLKTIRLALHDFIVAEFPDKFVVEG